MQEKGGDYPVSLKDNQPTVLAHVEIQLDGSPPFAHAPESRNGTVIGRSTASAPLVSQSAGPAHVRQATRVTRSVTDKKTGEVKTGAGIFLSSLPWKPGRAAHQRTGRLVRLHRTVDNNIHWLRDGVWQEDPCRSRSPNAACAPALLRTALLAPLRASGRTSLTTALECFAENTASSLSDLLIKSQKPGESQVSAVLGSFSMQNLDLIAKIPSPCAAASAIVQHGCQIPEH